MAMRCTVGMISLAVLTLSGCETLQQAKDLEARNSNLQATLDDMEVNQGRLEEENRLLRAERDEMAVSLRRSEVTAEEASAVRDDLADALADLESRLQGMPAVAAGDVSVLWAPEGRLVRIGDEVLFDSGSTVIKARGKEILGQIADELASGGLSIRVEGHTDSDKVKKQASKFPYGNLQLSAMRAVVVADFLTQTTGVEPAHMSVAGYGASRPLAANDTAENKRRNRRVEILILDQS